MSTVSERVAELLRSNKDCVYTPTEIGEALGYDYNQASGAVAPALKKLVAEGKVAREVMGRSVDYYWKDS